MYNSRRESGGGGGGGRREDGGGNSMFMNVSSGSVGAIIGKGGDKIRYMEKTAKARIKIHDGDSGSGERRVEIMGSPEEQEAARQMIEQVLDGTFREEDIGGGYGGGGRNYGGGGGRNYGGGGGRSYGGGGGRSYGGGGGGRSYGGGGGGGGASGPCYGCGEHGHFARECPNEPRDGGSGMRRGGGRSGGGMGPCYTCGQNGHIARDCTSESQGSYDNRGGGRW